MPLFPDLPRNLLEADKQATERDAEGYRDVSTNWESLLSEPDYATREEILQARALYGSLDIEIDRNALCSRDTESGTGCWVSAWVWLPPLKEV
jgi:hypothetical protein